MTIDLDSIENLILDDKKPVNKKAQKVIDLDSIEDRFFGDDTPKAAPVKKSARTIVKKPKTNTR